MVDLLQTKTKPSSGSEPFSLIIVFVILTMAFGSWMLYGTSKVAVAVPQLITFQAKLTDASRITIPNGSINVKPVIYTASSGGTGLWCAANTDANTATVDCTGGGNPGSISVTATDGVISILLGDTTGSVQNAFPGNLFSANSVLYLGLSVGSDAEMSPRIRLSSAPYASESDTVDGFSTSQTGGNNVIEVSDASGNVVMTGSVKVTPGQGITTSSAGALAIGSAPVTTISLTTDGTGDGEVTLPTGSVSGTEIADNTLNFSDFSDSLTIDGATTIAFTSTGASDTLVYSFTNNAGSSTTQRAFSIANALTSQETDVITEALFRLDNADTSATGSTVVADGIVLTVSGSIANGITDAIDASDANISNALNVGDNTITGIAAVIDFFEFDVSGTNGSITINDGSDAGALSVEGTNLDINSLDFVAGGAVSSTSGVAFTSNAGASEVIKSTTSGSAAALHLDDTAGSANSGISSALIYETIPDVSDRHAMYINTEETTAGQVIFAIESDSASPTDQLVFKITADGQAFSDVGFSSGATTKFADGVIHKVDAGTLAISTFGGAGDDILFDGETLTIESDENEIGLGTRDPQAHLDIAANDASEFIRLTGSSDFAGIFSGDSEPLFSAGGGSLYLLTDANGTGTPALYFNASTTDNGSGWTAMPINGITNVTEVTNNYYSSGGGGGSSSVDFEDVYGDDADKTLTLGVDGLAFDTTDTDMAVAETFASVLPLAAGDLVAIDATVEGDVIATSSAYQSGLVGVVTETPALVLRDVEGYNVARSGVVIVNVSDENGAIAVGDPLVASSTAGMAMRSSEPGMIVGFALSAWAGPGVGTVSVGVYPHWYAGNVITTDSSVMLVSDDVVFTELGTADDITTGFSSGTLSLRGSGWNGEAATNVAMKIVTDVTSATDYRLSIKDTAGAEVAYMTNQGTLRVAGDAIVGGHLYPSDRGVVQTDKYIYYDGSEGFGGDFMRTNASGWGTGSYDFAEMFPSDESLESGDVVVFDSADQHVRRSSDRYDGKLAGIVSTRPGFLAGENLENHFPIALAGRVPTKVNTENGAIEVGDPLTTSSTPGFAMKATKAGPIVGYALEPYDSTTQRLNDSSTIIAFVNVSFYGGDELQSHFSGVSNTASTLSGNLASLDMTGNIYMGGNEILNVGRLAGLSANWEISPNGTLTTKGSYDVAIESYQGDAVTAHAVLSIEHKLTLSGSAKLSGGIVIVKFEDVDPNFNDVISTIAPIRVFTTLREPANGLFVSASNQNGFTVQETMAGGSDATFDWFVEAYRKDYEPEDTLSVEAPEVVEEPVIVEEVPVIESPPELPATSPEPPTSTEPTPELPATSPEPQAVPEPEIQYPVIIEEPTSTSTDEPTNPPDTPPDETTGVAQ